MLILIVAALLAIAYLTYAAPHSAVHLNGHPIVPRVFRWGWFRWRGYRGDDRPGYSYGLCPETHLTPWMAWRCARSLCADQARRTR